MCNLKTQFYDNTECFLVNDQLDAQFFSMYLFQFSTCFEQPRINFISTTSGICHSVSVTVSCAGRK